jgi:hypothetical protein
MRIGDGGSDFQVDPEQLGGVAGELGRAYDDFQTAIVDDGMAFTEPSAFGDAAVGQAWQAFGDAAVGQAWQAFDGAWTGEMAEVSAALAEMVRNVETTAQRYRETEQAITRNLNGIGAR